MSSSTVITMTQAGIGAGARRQATTRASPRRRGARVAARVGEVERVEHDRGVRGVAAERRPETLLEEVLFSHRRAPSEAVERTGQPRPHPRGRSAGQGCHLGRVEVSRVAQRDERPVLRLQVTEGVRQVDVPDRPPGSLPGRPLRRDHELDDGMPPPVPQDLPRLVRGDRDEPGLEAVRVAERGELPPGDPQGRLGGVIGESPVAGDDERDAERARVVGGDDPGERELIARDRALQLEVDAVLSRARLVWREESQTRMPGVPS